MNWKKAAIVGVAGYGIMQVGVVFGISHVVKSLRTEPGSRNVMQRQTVKDLTKQRIYV